MWELLDLNISRTIAEVLDSAGAPNHFPTRRPRGENIEKTSRKASTLTGFFFDRKGEYKLKSSETLGFPRVFPQSKKKRKENTEA